MSRKIKTRPRFFRRTLEESSFIRRFLWKYRRFVFFGLGALIVLDILEIVPPLILKAAVDEIVQTGPEAALAGFALGYFSVMFVQGLCRYAWRMFLVRTSMLSGGDLREIFAGHLFRSSPSFFDRRKIGDLMSHATNDTLAVRRAIGSGLIVFADALFYFLTIPIAMFILSPELTLLAFLPLPIVPFLVFQNERKIHRRFQKVQESFSKLSSIAQESLMGIRLTKAFAREDVLIKKFGEAGKEYVRLNLRLGRVQAAFGPTLDFVMSLGLVVLLYFGGKSVIGNAVTLGTFVAFQRYIQKLVWPMAALGLAVTFYQRAVASSDRIKKVLNVEPDVDEPKNPLFPVRKEGRIEFRNLSFRYPGSSKPAIKNFSLMIEPDERLALIGQVGAGKTAILSLLPRLYSVENQMLFIDGVDINRWPLSELRKNIGFVSQETFLFSDTVTENLAFGLYEWIDEREKVLRAKKEMQTASVLSDALRLNAGLDTPLGERGSNVSGGQKQRLTIARALIKDPKILVLDDALSSIDVETENIILKNLKSRKKKRTELISAHRISTIQDADRIVVMEEGEMIQIGTHRELIRSRSRLYRRFYDQQKFREEQTHVNSDKEIVDQALS